MSHPLALSFCMRSTPITLVLLSFPHNRSLSLYSPLLNWSILHLNHDISTPLLEKEGENKNKWASYVKWYRTQMLCLRIVRFLPNNVKNKDRNICKCAGGCTAVLIWAPQPYTDQYTFKSRLRRAITISGLIRKRQTCYPNYHLKWLV